MFCIRVKFLPEGDRSDIITSSSRETSEKTTVTAASVTAIPASRMLRSEEWQIKADDREAIVILGQRVSREIAARYVPKFEPETLMLLRRCEVTVEGDGVL